MQQFMGYIPNRFKVKTLLFIGALFFLILALANWQKGSGNATAKRKGVDIMIALDVSKSMWAKDLQPDRLSRAKLFVNKLLDKVENDRVGLIVFAGNAYLQVPITSDHAALKMMLQAVSPDMVPTQGTEVGAAINLACTSLSSKNRNSKTIILISDGEDHDEQSASAIETAKEAGISIQTVGVGSEKGAAIFDPNTQANKIDAQGNEVISKLNRAALETIAQQTNGTYSAIDNMEESLKTITAKIDQMTTTEFESVLYTDYTNYFQIPLAIALLLLIVAMLLKTTTNKLPKTLSVLLLCMWVFNPSLYGQENKLLKKANALYKEKKYKEASQSYQKALQLNQKNSTAHFNNGNSLYGQKNKEAARKEFDQATKWSADKQAKSNAQYNMGNTYMDEKKWEEAIAYYKNALKLNADDQDAKYNLSYALAMKKKEDQNKKKDQQNKKQDQQKKDNKDNKDNKKDQKDQQQKQDQQKDGKNQEEKNNPSQQPSKLSKQQAEQLLQALMQEEKKLQDKKRQERAQPIKKEKDW
jgi:Ca-activated chloride channel family protein